MLNFDIAGKLRRTKLSKSKPLLPLYEAIKNSVQAIEDAGICDGRINIEIHREPQLIPDSAGDIIGFGITDNGVGFDDERYNAFGTAYTSFNVNKGGMGNGRFLWLVAFEKVLIESCYSGDRGLYTRSFEFAPVNETPRQLAEPNLTERRSTGTYVQLIGFKDEYRKPSTCPKKSETIAGHLVEHFLQTFIGASCPKITLHDSSTDEVIDLNAICSAQIQQVSKPAAVTVQGHVFYILHLQLYFGHVSEPKIYYCVQDRPVKSQTLLGSIPNLTKRLTNSDGKPFVYAAYVSGEIFDASVDWDRTELNIPEDNAESLLDDELTWKVIRPALFGECGKYLKAYTEAVRIRHDDRIQSFVRTAPMYQSILKHAKDRLALVDPDNLSDRELDIHFYKAYQDVELSLREEGEVLRIRDGDSVDWDDYQVRLEAYISKVDDIKKSDLSRYVCHRASILEFLSMLLGAAKNGEYFHEGHVHDVIFPRRKTSTEVAFSEHNLWVLNEKLSFHTYLASDKPLSTDPNIEIHDNKELDILVYDSYDKACAFGDEAPYQSISIVEFKRPMRKEYNEQTNPFVQVHNYVLKIRSGTARTVKLRPLNTPDPKNIPIYCYIVCDKADKLDKFARARGYHRTPDGDGYFGYNDPEKYYIEVVSYSKMLNDAKKQNSAFFHALGIPGPKIG